MKATVLERTEQGWYIIWLGHNIWFVLFSLLLKEEEGGYVSSMKDRSTKGQARGSLSFLRTLLMVTFMVCLRVACCSFGLSFEDWRAEQGLWASPSCEIYLEAAYPPQTVHWLFDSVEEMVVFARLMLYVIRTPEPAWSISPQSI